MCGDCEAQPQCRRVDCSEPAEFICEGTEGNNWFGWYCGPHKDMLVESGHYKHQATPEHPSGVRVRPLVQT